MSRIRQAAVGLAGLRILYGVALAAAPARTTRSWLGPDGASAGGKVALRGLGGREVVVHAGAIAAALSGAPVRPWLIGSIAGDSADIAATFASSGGLPEKAAVKTLVVAGVSAALTVAVVAALDE